MTVDVKRNAAPGPGEAGAGTVRHASLDGMAIVLLLMSCALLAVGQVAIKVANTGIAPLMQAGLRSVGAAVLLGGFARLRGVRLVARDGILWPALLAGVFFAAEFALLYPGLARTTAAHAVVLLYTSPFVVAVGAHILIPGDRLTGSKLAGLVLAFLGVAAVMLSRETVGAANGPTIEGDLLCLAGAFAWGFLTLTIRASRLAAVSPERVTFLQLAISAPMLCGLSALLGEAATGPATPLVIGAFAYTVVFVGFICFTTTNKLLTRYPASKVMAFLLPTPVFGVVAGHLLLGEAIGPGLVAGLALVVSGLWLVNRPPPRS
jgi:drug/metabolite transporter (DMT)-like permease